MGELSDSGATLWIRPSFARVCVWRGIKLEAEKSLCSGFVAVLSIVRAEMRTRGWIPKFRVEFKLFILNKDLYNGARAIAVIAMSGLAFSILV